MFRSRGEPQAEKGSAGGYVRDMTAGTAECQHCGTRAFSRNPLILAIWERAHSTACFERQRLAPAAIPSS